MKKAWTRILPWGALISGILVILLLGLAIGLKPSKNTLSTVNRKMALEKLTHIRMDSTVNLNSKAFVGYIEKVLDCPAISTKWLISAKGEIVYANGTMVQSTPLNSSIYNLVDDQSRGLIDAVEGNLDPVEKNLLYAAASIRHEGDHNDIYGHLVMPLKTSSNVLAGFVGVAYSLDDSKQPFRYYDFIITALVLCFLLYWLLLPIWVFFDCRERNSKYILWSIFVLFGNIPAVLAYLLSDRN